MDRRQAFKQAKNLINKASILYSLRDYDLNDYINFPLGVTTAKIFKSKRMDIANKMAVAGVKAKMDRTLNIKLRLEVQRYNDEELQQIANSIMRIFSASVMKKAEDAISNDGADVKQKRINTIGKTNNACIFLLERIAREIIMYRTLGKDNLTILDGLSSRMLSYLAIVVRRNMLLQGMDDILEKYSKGNLSQYEESFVDDTKNHQILLDALISRLKDRGQSQIDRQMEDCATEVAEYVNNGYSSLFK